jgi:hypothetical protein
MQSVEEERLHKAALDAIVRGEDREDLLDKLEAHVGHDHARMVIDRAYAEFEALKKSGRLHDFEMSVLDRKTRTTIPGYVGICMVFIALGAAAIAYFDLFPGSTYRIPVGLFIVGLFLVATGVRKV